VHRLYEQQVGAGTGEIVLVGDFDVAAVTKQLGEVFGGWKKGAPYKRIEKKSFSDVKGSRSTIETPDKENAIYLAGLTFPMRDTDPDYAAMTLGNYVLGGSGFTSRLMDRLRQKEGWSYGAGSQMQVDSQDKVAGFLAFAICNPKVIEKVDQGALEEIRKLLKEGVTADELAAAKKGYLEELKVERGSDSSVAGTLQHYLYLGRTYAFEADLEKKIAALSVEDVNQALAAHVDPGRLVIVRAGDFAKGGTAPKK
jgi:zinc protease